MERDIRTRCGSLNSYQLAKRWRNGVDNLLRQEGSIRPKLRFIKASENVRMEGSHNFASFQGTGMNGNFALTIIPWVKIRSLYCLFNKVCLSWEKLVCSSKDDDRTNRSRTFGYWEGQL